MTIEEAIELLANATYSDEWQGNEDLQTAHLMSMRSLEAWKELKNERKEWIKSDCSPYTPDVVKAYLKDIEVGE